MSETVINIVMLGFIIAAVFVGVFSPLFALLMAFWKWYRESNDAGSAQTPETPHAGVAQR
jgi:hypothetical protein